MRKITLLVAAMALAVFLMVVPAWGAATFTVNTTLDASDANQGDGVCRTAANQCTLRAAIQEANAFAGDDTIEFAPGVSGTITLSGGQDDGPLRINSNIKINGPGANVLSVSGNDQSGVFLIPLGHYKVDIGGLTITGGNAGLNDGGGILSASKDAVTVSNSTISGNKGAWGGGIRLSGGTLTVVNSTISGNSANNGGGIDNNNGTLTVKNSTISGNNSAINFGGILNSYGGTLTVTNSAISGNNSGSLGGGIYNYAASATVTNSTISGNSADLGGGIFNEAGIYNGVGSTVTVTKSTISANSAGFGGGIYNYVDWGAPDDGRVAEITVSNSTLSDNEAFNSGGAILNDSRSMLTVTNSTISDNGVSSAPSDTGGIENWGTADISNTIIANSRVFGTTFTAANCGGAPNDLGYNISSDSTCFFSAQGSLNDTDPKLAALADNGGPTKTHALLAGSPALNAIPSATNGCGTTITTDQRGVKRPQAGKCEIGALEQDVPPTVTSVVPKEGATGIAPGANVSAFFSEAMRAGSINTDTVKLFRAVDNSSVEASVTYGGVAKKATLDPSANLVRGARYKAVVSTGAKDLAGNRLDQNPTLSGNQPKAWFFTVRN